MATSSTRASQDHYLHFLLCRVVHHLVSPQAFLRRELIGWTQKSSFESRCTVELQRHDLWGLLCLSGFKLQVYLHGEAFPTPCVRTAEGPLPLMVSIYVTVQVEAESELFVAPFLGAQEPSLCPRMDTQLVLAQEPGVIKQLLTQSARHLGCRDKWPFKNPV